MSAAEDYQRLLKTRGIHLHGFGLPNIALEREDALVALELLRRAAIPILGGDVYFRRGDEIELAYANWHSDALPAEERAQYLRRTWDTTERYIRNFPPTSSDRVPIFTFVIPRSYGIAP